MKKYIKNICGALALTAAFTACDSKLDVHNPGALTDEQIENILANGTDEERELV